jgi:hypothetical protein
MVTWNTLWLVCHQALIGSVAKITTVIKAQVAVWNSPAMKVS